MKYTSHVMIIGYLMVVLLIPNILLVPCIDDTGYNYCMCPYMYFSSTYCNFIGSRLNVSSCTVKLVVKIKK